MQLQELTGEELEEYVLHSLGRSPHARTRSRFSIGCDKADPLPALSRPHTTAQQQQHQQPPADTYGDLCCGESDVFQENLAAEPGLFARELSQQLITPNLRTHVIVPASATTPPYSGQSVMDYDLQEMIRWDLYQCMQHIGLSPIPMHGDVAASALMPRLS